jgi:hypothetical protein
MVLGDIVICEYGVFEWIVLDEAQNIKMFPHNALLLLKDDSKHRLV